VVRKLLQLRRRTGSLAPVGHRGGPKSMFTPTRRRYIKQLVRQRPDITLAELREALGLTCALSTLHYVLAQMKLTFKKDAARRRAGATRRQGKSPALEVQTP
jgi:transposase